MLQVHYGAVFAMLNVAPLAAQQETLVAAKVSHSTQLVLLGQCPSLGFCAAFKKDGQPCSMPCDREKTGGKLVCFYHTMHQEAQKVKKLAGLNKGRHSMLASSACLPGSSDSNITVTSSGVAQPLTSSGRPAGPRMDRAAERLLKNPLPSPAGPNCRLTSPESGPHAWQEGRAES